MKKPLTETTITFRCINNSSYRDGIRDAVDFLKQESKGIASLAKVIIEVDEEIASQTNTDDLMVTGVKENVKNED